MDVRYNKWEINTSYNTNKSLNIFFNDYNKYKQEHVVLLCFNFKTRSVSFCIVVSVCMVKFSGFEINVTNTVLLFEFTHLLNTKLDGR